MAPLLFFFLSVEKKWPTLDTIWAASVIFLKWWMISKKKCSISYSSSKITLHKYLYSGHYIIGKFLFTIFYIIIHHNFAFIIIASYHFIHYSFRVEHEQFFFVFCFFFFYSHRTYFISGVLGSILSRNSTIKNNLPAFFLFFFFSP